MKRFVLVLFALFGLTMAVFAQSQNFNTLKNQAQTYFQQREYEKSNQCYEQIIKELQNTEYESLIPTIKTSIAINNLYIGIDAYNLLDYTKAKTYFEKALDYAKPESKAYYTANSWMGEWYSTRSLDIRLNNGNLSDALQYSKSAESFFDLALKTEKRLNQQLVTSNILSDLKRNNESVILLNNIISECENEYEKKEIIGKAFIKLGTIELLSENLQPAILHLESGYRICNENNSKFYAYLAADKLHQLYTYQIPDQTKAEFWKQCADKLDSNDRVSFKTSNGQYYNTIIDAKGSDVILYEDAINKIVFEKKYSEGIYALTNLIAKRANSNNYPMQDIASYYITRAQGWQGLSQYQNSENDCKIALSILENCDNQDKSDMILAWEILAIDYFYWNKSQEALLAADKSVEISLNYYGELHGKTIDAIEIRSNIEGFNSLKEKALDDRQRIFKAVQKNVEQNFTYLTMTERSSYWNKYYPITRAMFTFAHMFNDWNSSFTDELFNQQLLSKGLLITTENTLQRAIDNNAALKSKYQEIRELRILSMNDRTSPSDAETAIIEADRKERSLGESANAIHQYMDFLKIHQSDVKNSLKSDEVAIEFADYRIGKDSIMYAALIMSPKWEHCLFLPLVEERTLTVHNANLTESIWKPIIDKLNDDVKKIYFAPTGSLYLIPIESMAFPDGSLISDKYQLYRLSSTRWLAYESNTSVGTDAIVYGGLRYDMDIEDMLADANTRKVMKSLPYLEGTKTEAIAIADIINNSNKNIHAEIKLEKEGTETSFKLLDGKQKRIIHIGTHGSYENNGRLYFAGANNKYLGDDIPEGLDDGILTSMEISELNLSGLDLITLSACQTGLGEVTSDGVSGLQRAFKKAGAQSILMSLWEVNDEATSMLMTEFYKNWICIGVTKHDALEMAKRTVRSRKDKEWDNPYYWAAFVLLDSVDR